MGYYTYFELNANLKDNKYTREPAALNKLVKNLEEEIDKMQVFESGDYSNGWSSYTKWYDHESDVALLSSRYPMFMFVLSGQGEESQDLWEEYFVDGKCQHSDAIITYEEFAPEKLKNVELCDKYSWQE